MIRVGSAFSGIGGFELGVEESWDHLGVETVWQIEKDSFCQQVLKKHWPNATLHEDITTIEPSSLEPVDVIIGGFPCQDISIAGKQKGVNEGEKSGLWWKLWNIIGELRPRILILENVSNIIRVGGSEVLGSLAEIGYDSEWQIIRASDFGAPHQRARWFCVAFQTSNTNGSNCKEHNEHTKSMEKKIIIERGDRKIGGIGSNYWKNIPNPSPVHHVDDGISDRVAKLRSLGNAIVPACSKWVADQVLQSGLLNDLLEDQT